MMNRKTVWLTERRERSRLHLQPIKDMARIIQMVESSLQIFKLHMSPSLLSLLLILASSEKPFINKEALNRVETKFGRACGMTSGLLVKTMGEAC